MSSQRVDPAGHRPKTRSQTKAQEQIRGRVKKNLYPELPKLESDLPDEEEVEDEEEDEEDEPYQQNRKNVPYDRSPTARIQPRRPRENITQQPPKSKSTGSWCTTLLWMVTIALIGALGGIFSNQIVRTSLLAKDQFLFFTKEFSNQLFVAKNNFNPNELELRRENFERLLATAEVSDNVPAIGKNVFKVVFEKATSNPQKAPAVLLLIASADQQDRVRNISHRLANLMATGDYDDDGNHKSGTTVAAIQLKPEHTKKDIEQFYQQAFEQPRQPVLLLEDLEQLDPAVAMVFHQFMDGENSRFRLDSFVIVTLKYSKPLTVGANASPRDLSDISASILGGLWRKEMGKDKMDCIINRIAEHSVVLVNKN